MRGKPLPKLKIIKINPVKIRIPTLRLRYRCLLYAVTIVFAALSLVNVICGIFPYPAEILSYVMAACTLFASCYYLIKDIRYGVVEKVKPGIEANPLTNRMVKDYRYRTIVSAVPGLIFNIIFAVFNGVLGIISRSAWFGSMSAYYILLSVMRFYAVKYNRRAVKLKQTKKLILEEINVYRNCGILFMIMTIALGGAVILLVCEKGGKNYPGVAIFAVAAYTFYKIVISIINRIKAGKLKAPLLMAIRDIGYIDACVSILSLQTAMFASFGEGKTGLEKQMNAATGTAVCLIIFFVGVRCIRSSGKMKRGILEGGNVDDSHTCGRG